MNLAAVFHQPMSEYCYGLDETHIVYRLRCARGDVRRVTLSYGDTACRVTPIVFTTVEMELVAWDETHDYWEVVVDSPYNRVYYYFTLFGTDGSWIYYYGDEFTQVLVDERSEYFKLPFNHRADIAQVPDWARDALVYNIFPDSFASGQGEITGKGLTTIDIRIAVSSRLGGTLDGVAANAAYLKDLGFNCVYLNPIFAAGEYHKYDTLDYFHVDPCFGGDEAFRRMVDTLHGRESGSSSTACSTTAAGTSGPLRTWWKSRSNPPTVRGFTASNFPWSGRRIPKPTPPIPPMPMNA